MENLLATIIEELIPIKPCDTFDFIDKHDLIAKIDKIISDEFKNFKN